MTNSKRWRWALAGLSVTGLLALLAFELGRPALLTAAGLVINSFRSADNPAGRWAVEQNGAVSVLSTSTAPAMSGQLADQTQEDWPLYNKTLESQRFSNLADINTLNVSALKELCRYDAQVYENFETGPLVIGRSLVFTSARDVFSIDAESCRENWRTHEDPALVSGLLANRGAAYLSGAVFRGTLDGKVVAYDFNSGRKLWSTAIADPQTGELVDAAPIAWEGLVFIGTAMGDSKGVRGRVYALNADTGRIVWENYLVPRQPQDPERGPQGSLPSVEATWSNRSESGIPVSGGGTWTSYTLDPRTAQLYVPVGNPAPDFVASVRQGTNLYTNSVLIMDARTGRYVTHFQISPSDWHDWDVSNTPTLVTTRGGRRLMAFSPKDGHLFGYDLQTGRLLYRSAVTRIENAEVPLTPDQPVHFCPGSAGGGEWNGAAYDPLTNLILTGTTDWCTTVKIMTKAQLAANGTGQLWTGAASDNPLDIAGTPDPHQSWAGWLYATDADSGQWQWRAKSNYPLLSGITPTAGGLVLFGDMGGNFYAVDARTGKKLFHRELPGAIGGGVLTYRVDGRQRIAVVAGMTSGAWPVKTATGKILIFGLEPSAALH